MLTYTTRYRRESLSTQMHEDWNFVNRMAKISTHRSGGWKKDLDCYMGAYFRLNYRHEPASKWPELKAKFFEFLIDHHSEWKSIRNNDPLEYLPYMETQFERVTGYKLVGLEACTEWIRAGSYYHWAIANVKYMWTYTTRYRRESLSTQMHEDWNFVNRMKLNAIGPLSYMFSDTVRMEDFHKMADWCATQEDAYANRNTNKRDKTLLCEGTVANHSRAVINLMNWIIDEYCLDEQIVKRAEQSVE